MATDVWEYWAQREAECAQYSFRVESGGLYEAQDSGGHTGRIFARLGINDWAYIQISERVVVHGKSIRRLEYGYYLMIHGEEYFSRDFDRYHGYHGHVQGHERVPAGRVTFKQFAEKAWGIIAHEHERLEHDDANNEA